MRGRRFPCAAFIVLHGEMCTNLCSYEKEPHLHIFEAVKIKGISVLIFFQFIIIVTIPFLSIFIQYAFFLQLKFFLIVPM